ncbi:MAG TPA: YCF48-related protein, partial [Candidatus Krumholzibacteria bacterium]|nr:YCF48-related protein [Candidatus Krumholzibacteria bacterium]
QTSPGSLALNSVFFADADHGWIVGDSGKILHTTNGGANWTTSTPTSASLYGVFASDTQLAWAVGKGVVLRTTNGGANWTSASPTPQTLRGVFFLDNLLGYAVGTNGAVLKSTNGGSTWTTTTETPSDLYSVFFINGTTGWAVGETGVILSTNNGGTSWDTQRAGSVILRSVFFVDAQNGWAVGQSGTVVETSDGGVEWDITHPATVSLNGVFIKSIPSFVTAKVSTNPAGRTFSVDGVNYTSAQTFHWDPSSAHTIATPSLQSGGTGTQYVWNDWSNGGAISQEVTPETSTSYVANFTKQYQLTMQTAPNGTTTPSSGWFNADATVSITATPDPGFAFNGWNGVGSGSYSGWANPASVKMSAPITQTPAFGTNVSVVVKSSPSGRSFVVDGTTYTAQQTFSWVPGSSHTLDAPSPQGASGEYTFSHWSDNGSASHTIAPVSNTACTVYFTGGSSTPAFPTDLIVLQNSPNPATSTTDIRYGLPVSSDVTIELFDVTGRRVFVDRVKGVASGWQTYPLDIAAGKPSLRSGIYFVRVSAIGLARQSRMIILR